MASFEELYEEPAMQEYSQEPSAPDRVMDPPGSSAWSMGNDPNLLSYLSPATAVGYYPDEHSRDSLLKGYQITNNITIEDEDLMVLCNFHTNHSVVGHIYSKAAARPWTYFGPLEVAVDLNSFERFRCTGAVLTIFSDTISTTNTNLSGRMTTVNIYDLPLTLPDYAGISSYAIGPAHKVVNVALSEGTAQLMQPYYMDFQGTYPRIPYTEVPPNIDSDSPFVCRSYFAADVSTNPASPMGIFDYPIGSPTVAGTIVLRFTGGLNANGSQLFFGHCEYTLGAGTRVQPFTGSYNNLVPIVIPPGSMILHVHVYADAVATTPLCIEGFLCDPVLRRNGLNRTITMIQGSIGAKNINISGTANFQLIPTPDNMRQVTLSPCPGVTYRPLEAFRMLLAETSVSGFRMVDTKTGYLNFLRERLPTVLDYRYSTALAARPMGFATGFSDVWKRGVSFLKRSGINPAGLLRRGVDKLEASGFASDSYNPVLRRPAQSAHAYAAQGEPDEDQEQTGFPSDLSNEEPSALEPGTSQTSGFTCYAAADPASTMEQMMKQILALQEQISRQTPTAAVPAAAVPATFSEMHLALLQEMINKSYGDQGFTPQDLMSSIVNMISNKATSAYQKVETFLPRFAPYFVCDEGGKKGSISWLAMLANPAGPHSYQAFSAAFPESPNIANLYLDSNIRWTPTSKDLFRLLVMQPVLRSLFTSKSGGVVSNIYLTMFLPHPYKDVSDLSWTGALYQAALGMDPFSVVEFMFRVETLVYKNEVLPLLHLSQVGCLPVKFRSYLAQLSHKESVLGVISRAVAAFSGVTPSWNFRSFNTQGEEGQTYEQALGSAELPSGVSCSAIQAASQMVPFDVLLIDSDWLTAISIVHPTTLQVKLKLSQEGKLKFIKVEDDKSTVIVGARSKKEAKKRSASSQVVPDFVAEYVKKLIERDYVPAETSVELFWQQLSTNIPNTPEVRKQLETLFAVNPRIVLAGKQSAAPFKKFIPYGPLRGLLTNLADSGIYATPPGVPGSKGKGAGPIRRSFKISAQAPATKTMLIGNPTIEEEESDFSDSDSDEPITTATPAKGKAKRTGW